jgi:hypothetical protein
MKVCLRSPLRVLIRISYGTQEDRMLCEFDGKRPVTGTDTYVSETAIIIGDVRIGGDPAEKIKDMSEKDVEFSKHSRRIYVDLAAKYRRLGMERID